MENIAYLVGRHTDKLLSVVSVSMNGQDAIITTGADGNVVLWREKLNKNILYQPSNTSI